MAKYSPVPEKLDRVVRLPSSLLALALAAGAVAAGPVVSPDAEPSCFLAVGEETEEVDDDVEACRQDVWFHEAGTKVDNVDHAQETFASFDTTPPESSVADGAGSGVLTTSALHQQAEAFDARESFVAAGEFTGAIDNVVVELYMFRPGVTPGFTTDDPTGATVGGTTHSVDAVLRIDGFDVATLADVDATLEPAGEAAEKITFVFRDVMEVLPLLGDVEGKHTVEVRTHGTGIGSDAAIVVYDTTEVPSGMVINAPAELIAEVDELNNPSD